MARRVLAALILFLALARTGAAEAPDRYVVIISQVDLKRADGTWVRVVRPDKPVDLALEEARVVFYNGARRPLEGDFVNFRILLEGGVLYRGSAAGRPTDAEEGRIVLGEDLEPRAYRPTAIGAQRPDGTGLATFVRSGPDGVERTVRFSVACAEDLSVPVRLAAGSTVVARFDVDLRAVLERRAAGELEGLPESGRVLPRPPRITSITLVVDEDERALDAGQVRLTAMGPDASNDPIRS